MPIDPDRYYQLVGPVKEGSRLHDLLHYRGATRRVLHSQGLGEYLYIPHLPGEETGPVPTLVGLLPPRRKPRKDHP